MKEEQNKEAKCQAPETENLIKLSILERDTWCLSITSSIAL